MAELQFMEDEVIENIWPSPDENGQYPLAVCEQIVAPGNCAFLLLVQHPDGWRSGYDILLPGHVTSPVLPAQSSSPELSRASAVVTAAEMVVAFCSEQNEQGSKKHRGRIAAIQEWALEEARKSGADRPAMVQTSTEPVLSLLPISDIFESPLNPRQVYPEAPMAELVESMRASGFRAWQPLVVRPRRGGGHDLAAGHRRRLAAERAGITHAPCLIREMSDAEFLDVLNFDNSGREDVHPLHEASGWRMWMEKTGSGAKDIAARIGQSIEYVYQRLKYAALIPEAQEQFLNGKMTAGHAILVSRQQADGQKKALEYLKPRSYDDRVPSVRELANWLHNEINQDLRDAPFDKEDVGLLPGAGACSVCPKRLANDPGYQPLTVEDSDEALQADGCTDTRCYEQKLTNHLVRIKESAGEGAIEITQGWSSRKKGVLSKQEYEIVEAGSKKDANVKTAVVVEGLGVGNIVFVRVKPKPPGSPAKAKSGQASRVDWEKEREEKRVKAEAELAIRRKILSAISEKVVGLQRADLQAILAVDLDELEASNAPIEMLCQMHGITASRDRAHDLLVAALPKMQERDLIRLLIEVSAIGDFDEYDVLSCEPMILLGWAKRYKVDAAKFRQAETAPVKKPAAKKIAKKTSLPKKAAAKPKKQLPVKKTKKK